MNDLILAPNTLPKIAKMQSLMTLLTASGETLVSRNRCTPQSIVAVLEVWESE